MASDSMLDSYGLDEEKDLINRLTEELDTYFGVNRYTLRVHKKMPHRPAVFELVFSFRDATDITAYAEITPNMLNMSEDKYVHRVVKMLVDDAFDALVEHWHFTSDSDMSLQKWLNMDNTQYDVWAKGGGKPNGWTFRSGTQDAG